MNGKHPDQFYEVFGFSKGIQIPPSVQDYVHHSVENARTSYEKATALTQRNVKVLEEAVTAAHEHARAIGDKVLRDAEINVTMAFNAAGDIARAKTLPELVRLQTEFVQSQLSAAGKQGKELFELSSKQIQNSFEQLSSAVAKCFDHINNK